MKDPQEIVYNQHILNQDDTRKPKRFIKPKIVSNKRKK